MTLVVDRSSDATSAEVRDVTPVPAPPPAPALVVARPPLSAAETVVRRVLWLAGGLLLALGLNVTVVSQFSYHVWQHERYNVLRTELALGTAPVSEVDLDGRLVVDGAPIAYLSIPKIGLDTVIVEGSSSGATMYGPGHRRDTVLPGQGGTSVVYGRAAAYGAPFGKIEQLAPGDTFTVTTGQGEHRYRVIGVRYAGDAAPPPPESDESRLVLVTARGSAFAPSGVARIDAELTSEAYPAGARITTYGALPRAAEPLAMDTSTVWALVLWLIAFLVLEIGFVWTWLRWGRRQAWLVFATPGLAVGFMIADQVTKLLPNLM